MTGAAWRRVVATSPHVSTPLGKCVQFSPDVSTFWLNVSTFEGNVSCFHPNVSTLAGQASSEEGESTCVGGQGLGHGGSHMVRSRQRALQSTRSLRMQATRATLAGLPAVMRRW